MRMWMVEPRKLCNKHLLGEHGEIHKHRHNFEKHHSIDGRLSPVVQVEPSSMASRHNELAHEMICRGMNHESPFTQPDISYLPEHQQNAKVLKAQSHYDLQQRCSECRTRIQGAILEKTAKPKKIIGSIPRWDRPSLNAGRLDKLYQD